MMPGSECAQELFLYELPPQPQLSVEPLVGILPEPWPAGFLLLTTPQMRFEVSGSRRFRQRANEVPAALPFAGRSTVAYG